MAYARGTQTLVADWTVAGLAPIYMGAGGWLLARKPDSWIGRLYLAIAMCDSLQGLAGAYASAFLGGIGVDWSMWFLMWSNYLPYSLMLVIFVLFPNRNARGSVDRVFIWLIAVWCVSSVMAAAFRPGLISAGPFQIGAVSTADLVNPIGIDFMAWLSEENGTAVVYRSVLGLALTLGLLVLLVTRRWTSHGNRRYQQICVLLVSIWYTFIPQIAENLSNPFLLIFIFAAFGIPQVVLVGALLRWDSDLGSGSSDTDLVPVASGGSASSSIGREVP